MELDCNRTEQLGYIRELRIACICHRFSIPSLHKDETPDIVVMAMQLPEDIWHLIFADLRFRRELQALFNSATLCRSLAPLALANLYRITDPSPGSDEESEGAQALIPQEDSHYLKWVIFWTSVISSGFKETLFPYASYLRSLDLRDLEYMLEDNKFVKHRPSFFRGSMATFDKSMKIKTPKGVVNRPDVLGIVSSIGGMLTQHTPLLEQLSGKFSSDALLQWIPRLPKLHRLELGSGEALGDEKVHHAVYQTCPRFAELSVFRWEAEVADDQIGSFLSGLPKESLRVFTAISNCGTSLQTCLGLSNHGASLRHLNIHIPLEGVPFMGMLRGCTSLESLQIEMPPEINLESAHEEVFKEVVAWLSECRSLKLIELREFLSGPAILLPVMLNDLIALEDLSINGHRAWYSILDGRDFHSALCQQQSLHSLVLMGDAEDVQIADTDVLVGSVSQLANLRKLHLRGLADSFDDDRIIKILKPLQLLEEIYIGG